MESKYNDSINVYRAWGLIQQTLIKKLDSKYSSNELLSGSDLITRGKMSSICLLVESKLFLRCIVIHVSLEALAEAQAMGDERMISKRAGMQFEVLAINEMQIN